MKTSAARRVNSILRNAGQYRPKPSETALIAWGVIFGLLDPANKDPKQLREEDVTQLLSELRNEIRQVQAILQTNEEAVPLAAPIIKKALAVSSVTSVAQDWNALRDANLPTEILTGWAWASLLLPAEDEKFSSEDLASLQALLDELERAVNESQVPEQLRGFTLRQVQSIRSAIVRHRVAGITPLREALDRGVGEMIRDQEALRTAAEATPEKSGAVLSRLADMWSTTAKYCGDLDKFQKAYVLMHTIYEKALPYLNKVSG